MDYKSAGVDTEKAALLIKNLSNNIKSTHKNLKTGSVDKNFGGFAGIFKANNSYHGYDLVSCTDGVGTKIQLAQKFDFLSGLGTDLVAMSVNDLYCIGAEPAFFLDYISCGKLSDFWYLPVINSIVDACKLTNMALLGGETAEHPGVIPDDDFDLAGFCVGFIHPQKKLPQIDVMSSKDVLIGIPSSGLHSNGFSLVRKILDELEQKNNKRYKNLIENEDFVKKELLISTRIYQEIPELLKVASIKGIAHITGGGFVENLPRMLPEHLTYDLDLSQIPRLKIYDFINEFVKEEDMLKTFNMGVGMVLVANESEFSKVKEFYSDAFLLGNLKDK